MKDFDYSTILLPRARNLLNYATKHQDQYPNIKSAMALYQSHSREKRRYFCNILLESLQISIISFKQYCVKEPSVKESSLTEYFFINFIPLCILYMVSKKSNVKEQSFTENDAPSISSSNNKSNITQQKVLEMLFALLASNTIIYSFECIGDIIGLKYDQARYGASRSNLMDFVQRCLFKPECHNSDLFKSPSDINGMVLTLNNND